MPSSRSFNRSLVLTAMTKIKIPFINKYTHFPYGVSWAKVLLIPFLNNGKRVYYVKN